MVLIQAMLTCADDVEATDIAEALIEQKLAACVKKMPIQSIYHWQGVIQNDSEVLLVIETLESKFKDIETLVKKLHSYDQFVLTATKVEGASAGVKKWVEQSCK